MPAPITNQITICNSALLKVGADVIVSITDNNRAAIVCNTLYNYLRDEVMGESPWRFATFRAVLVPNSTVPAFDYLYSYDIPSDCLRLLKTYSDNINWIVESGQILTNETSLDMIYLQRNTDESTWDARFCEAFAWRIAMELAMPLTKNIPIQQMCATNYEKSLAQARAMNAVIGTQSNLIADIWSGARRGDKSWRAQQGQTGDGNTYGPV